MARPESRDDPASKDGPGDTTAEAGPGSDLEGDGRARGSLQRWLDGSSAAWTWWLLPLLLATGTILAAPIPPMFDWYEHIAQSAMLARYSDPTMVPIGRYCLSGFQPYHTFHHVGRILFHLLGPELVSPTMLLLLLGTFAGALAWSLRSFGADPRMLGIGLPLFFGYCYGMGFGPNMLGLPLVLVGMGAAERYRRKPTVVRLVALQGVLLAALLIHPMPFYLASGCVGLYLLITCCGEWRKLVLGLVPVALAGAVSIVQLLSVLEIRYKGGALREPGLLEKLGKVPLFLSGVAADPPGAQVPQLLLALGLPTLALIPFLDRSWREKGRAYIGQALCALAVVVLYLAAPATMYGTAFVYQRLLQPAYMLLLLMSFCSPSRVWRIGLPVVWVLSLFLLTENLLVHGLFARRVAGVSELARKIPKGARVLVMAPTGGTRLLRQNVVKHGGAMVQVVSGGEVRYLFTNYRHMPVVDCNPGEQKSTGALSVWPWRYRVGIHGKYADHLVLYMPKNRRWAAFTYPFLLRRPDAFVHLATRGRWVLFRVKPNRR